MKKFGSHYAIERFGLLFCSLSLAMAVLVAMLTNTQIQRNRVALSGRAIYTGKFTMSQSGAVGNVQGLYVNSDQTKVLVLLQFDDMARISSQATEYDLAVAAVDTKFGYEEIKSRPAGLFYMFGSTGYAAIYLQDMSGFPSQILGVSLTAKSKLVAGGTGQQDIGFIYFNPGGAYATRAAFLDQDRWKFSEMVEEVMTRRIEIEQRQRLTTDLEKMLQQLLLINEYKTRLTRDMKITIPLDPAYVEDTIYAVPTAELSTRKLSECTKLLMEDYSYERGGWLTSDHSKGYFAKDVTLFLDARAVVPGGHDFTWQTGRILTGYLPYLTESKDVLQWRNYMQKKQESFNPNLMAFATEVSRFRFTKADGTAFPVIRTKNREEEAQQELLSYNDGDKEINYAINLLIEAWEAYYDLKVQYETVDLPALLKTEIDANDMLTTYTVNTDGVRIY